MAKPGFDLQSLNGLQVTREIKDCPSQRTRTSACAGWLSAMTASTTPGRWFWMLLRIGSSSVRLTSAPAHVTNAAAAGLSAVADENAMVGRLNAGEMPARIALDDRPLNHGRCLFSRQCGRKSPRARVLANGADGSCLPLFEYHHFVCQPAQARPSNA